MEVKSNQKQKIINNELIEIDSEADTFEYIDFDVLKEIKIENSDYFNELKQLFNNRNEWKNIISGIELLRSINKFDNNKIDFLLNEFTEDIIFASNSIRSFVCKLTLIFLKEVFLLFKNNNHEFIKTIEPILMNKNINVMKFIKNEIKNCYEIISKNCFSDILVLSTLKHFDNNILVIRDNAYNNLINIIKNNEIINLEKETIDKLFLQVFLANHQKKIKKSIFNQLVKEIKFKFQNKDLIELIKNISNNNDIPFKNLEIIFLDTENKENKMKSKNSFRNFLKNKKSINKSNNKIIGEKQIL